MTTPIRATYAAGQWHEVTPGAIWTQITHNSGSSSVIYSENAILPDGYDSTTPVNASSQMGDSVYFNSVTPGNNIYFYPLNGDVSMTITVAEV